MTTSAQNWLRFLAVALLVLGLLAHHALPAAAEDGVHPPTVHALHVAQGHGSTPPACVSPDCADLDNGPGYCCAFGHCLLGLPTPAAGIAHRAIISPREPTLATIPPSGRATPPDRPPRFS